MVVSSPYTPEQFERNKVKVALMYRQKIQVFAIAKKTGLTILQVTAMLRNYEVKNLIKVTCTTPQVLSSPIRKLYQDENQIFEKLNCVSNYNYDNLSEVEKSMFNQIP